MSEEKDTWVEDEPMSEEAQALAKLLPTDTDENITKSADLILEILSHSLPLADAVMGRWDYEILDYMKNTFPRDVPGKYTRGELIYLRFAQQKDMMAQEAVTKHWPDLKLSWIDMEGYEPKEE